MYNIRETNQWTAEQSSELERWQGIGHRKGNSLFRSTHRRRSCRTYSSFHIRLRFVLKESMEVVMKKKIKMANY